MGTARSSDPWSIKQPTNNRFAQLANKLAWKNMSSSIEKNRRSVALTGAERIRRHREKQRKNQTDHASIVEAQQQRPIPLSGAERIRRHRASKRQNQLNDVKAQNRSVALSDTERTR
jgi:hypothetical protein